MALYVLHILVILLFTLAGKKGFGRIRPHVPDGCKRMIDFRTKETNGSLPSGDVAQAAGLIFFLKFTYPHLYNGFGGDWFAFKFLGLVAIARVFH